MRKAALLKEQQRHRIFENAGLSMVQGSNFISVDIQPAYQDYFGFQPYEFGKYINTVFDTLNNMTFLFNGDSMGFPSEEEYRWWLIEDCGVLEENTASSYFFDKGYAFFRYCMDEGIDDDDLVQFIQYMAAKGVNDSREIDEDMWNDFMATSNVEQSEVRDLMENADDMIHIPEVMDFLRNYGGKIVVTGGGINECLKEVELALMALRKPYNVLPTFTY